MLSFIEIGTVVWAFYCEQTDRQTDTHTNRYTDNHIFDLTKIKCIQHARGTCWQCIQVIKIICRTIKFFPKAQFLDPPQKTQNLTSNAYYNVLYNSYRIISRSQIALKIYINMLQVCLLTLITIISMKLRQHVSKIWLKQWFLCLFTQKVS